MQELDRPEVTNVVFSQPVHRKPVRAFDVIHFTYVAFMSLTRHLHDPVIHRHENMHSLEANKITRRRWSWPANDMNNQGMRDYGGSFYADGKGDGIFIPDY